MTQENAQNIILNGKSKNQYYMYIYVYMNYAPDFIKLMKLLESIEKRLERKIFKL